MSFMLFESWNSFVKCARVPVSLFPSVQLTYLNNHTIEWFFFSPDLSYTCIHEKTKRTRIIYSTTEELNVAEKSAASNTFCTCVWMHPHICMRASWVAYSVALVVLFCLQFACVARGLLILADADFRCRPPAAPHACASASLNLNGHQLASRNGRGCDADHTGPAGDFPPKRLYISRWKSSELLQIILLSFPSILIFFSVFDSICNDIYNWTVRLVI